MHDPLNGNIFYIAALEVVTMVYLITGGFGYVQ